MSVSGWEGKPGLGHRQREGWGVTVSSKAEKTNQPVSSPLHPFLHLQSHEVQPLCVIDANDPPNGPAERNLNLQMTAFAGTTNHRALQSNSEGCGSLKDSG